MLYRLSAWPRKAKSAQSAFLSWDMIGKHNKERDLARIIAEKNIHRLFEVSIWLKGAHSLLEIVSGILLATMSTTAIATFVTRVTADELLKEPHDLVANYLLKAATQLSVGTKLFAAFYLLSHGAVKLFVVIGLIRDKVWAYPASLVVLGLFIAYQLYRFTLTHSVALLLLTLFDVIVIWLILHEYRLIRHHQPRK
jgi:uncharacterized membrane protein